jgi:succinate dehydrogenase hydrophobic anchor subunit
MNESEQSVVPIVPSTTSSEIQSAKSDIDKEYAAKPHGGSSTPWIILGLAIALIIIFVIIIVIFFFFFNPPAMHDIVVTNGCSQPINILFGALTINKTVQFLPVLSLNSGQTHSYKATPGVSIIVQGYRNGDEVLSDKVNPFTTVELSLAGQGFNGKSQITDNTNIITNLDINPDPNDKYGVSVQGGYNIPITITSTAFNNRDPTNRFSCRGPIWNHTIDATGPNSCPINLQSPGTAANYQVCLNPCTEFGGTAYCCTTPGICESTGGCEHSWPDLDYFTTFENACPTCLITNCDTSNFTCSSKNGLTQYEILFCP